MKSLLVPCRDTCFLCTGSFCLVTVAWTTKDFIALRKHFPHGEIKYEMGPVLCLGYMSGYLSLMGGLGLCWSSRSDRSHGPIHRPS